MFKKCGPRYILPLLLSLFSALGTVFLLFTFYAGADDILSARELIISAAVFILTAVPTFLISKRFPVKTLLLTVVTAVFAAAAINFEYPELMKLPMQLPAENQVQIVDLDDGASLSMTWAYWFRPRSQQGDLFLTNPDRDISFSQLTKQGTWEETIIGEDPILITYEKEAAIGIPQKIRTHLAVLCLKADGGTVTLKIPGSEENIMLTPEMTTAQPYRVIMKNGQLPDTAGNMVQIFFWSGVLFFGFLCGIMFGTLALSYRGKYRNTLICLSAFLVPCLIMLALCVFLKITPFGEKSFLINDMWGEYADYMAYFRTIISGENDLFYSFSKSLGDDLLSLLAFYVINPLNWLVCLFKPEKLPLAISILVILRYGISGLTASVYFVRRRKCGFSALLFSTCYALMSFNIVNAENTNLRESGLVLPLVIMGLEELIENRSFRTYIWALAGAIFLNFYSGYQICIFAALYFLCYFFSRQGNTSFWKTFRRFILSSLLAVGITAFLLVPVVLQLRNGPKSFDPEIMTFKINMPWLGLLGKTFCSAYDVNQISNGYPSLYTGLICVISIFLLFFNDKITRRNKICYTCFLVCCLLIMQINPLNLILHGFNEPLWWPYRYSFIICFFITMVAENCFSHRDGWNKTVLCLTAIFFGIFVLLLSRERYSWMNGNALYTNALLLSAYIMILFAVRNKFEIDFTILIAALTSLELFLNASHVLMVNTAYERSNTVSDYAEFFERNKPVLDQLKIFDNSFYRIEKSYSRTPNDPMLFGYNGISHYSSTLNKGVMDFLSQTGFRRYAPYRILYWEGSDISMDSLLGIKYLVSAGGTSKPYTPVFTENNYTVYENPYALPLMFTASKDLLDEKVDPDTSSYELQNQIFSALAGERTEIFRPAAAEGPFPDSMIAEQQSGDTCYAAEEGMGSLSWQITANGTDTLYAFFPAENIHPVTTSLNGNAYGHYFDNFSYHILRLGSFGNGETLTFGMVPMEDRVCMKDAQFFHEDIQMLEQTVSALKQDPAELKKITGSHLEGSFTASAEKMLFFTIPYSSGWTIKIDGQKVPLYQVFDTFMAVNAPEGYHTLEMRYIPVGLVPGIITSLVSIAIVLFIGKKQSVSTGS